MPTKASSKRALTGKKLVIVESPAKGKTIAGFFRAGSHEVVENERCLILPEESDKIKNIVTSSIAIMRGSTIERLSPNCSKRIVK